MPETQQAAQKRRAGVIQPPEQGDGFPGAGAFTGKCPPGKAAELFQRAAQQRVAADEMQFPDILILMLQPEFQRPQFIDGIEVGRHLGMTFIQQGTPPLRQGFAALEPALDTLSADLF